eukprot:TRINITY_DN7961_c0_g1_i1.p2 TRINITY_DN7961_c0_g1~~TRINITY_DN7961_c0_g1_i1.p2  ORF type:complete len:111 (-),score=26.45 TRINITY_DN7961_c0_g1_i1:140-472(-)
MLRFEPHRRWSAEQLLAHPYLKDVRGVAAAPPGAVFRWPWDAKEPSARVLHQLWWREIVHFQPHLRLTSPPRPHDDKENALSPKKLRGPKDRVGILSPLKVSNARAHRDC